MNRLLRRVLCGFLGWHKAPDVVWHDEVNTGGYCARCDVPVLEDSQGNWFENDWGVEPGGLGVGYPKRRHKDEEG